MNIHALFLYNNNNNTKKKGNNNNNKINLNRYQIYLKKLLKRKFKYNYGRKERILK